MDEAFAKLGSDAEFRTEYHTLWEQYRPRKVDLPFAAPTQVSRQFNYLLPVTLGTDA